MPCIARCASASGFFMPVGNCFQFPLASEAKWRSHLMPVGNCFQFPLASEAKWRSHFMPVGNCFNFHLCISCSNVDVICHANACPVDSNGIIDENNR